MADGYLAARQLRFAIVLSQHRQGNVTREEALSLLAGRLSPNDPATMCDDSRLLDMALEEATAELGLALFDKEKKP
jgi:hypothetical protein